MIIGRFVIVLWMAICLASANPDTTTTGQLNTFPSGPIPQEEWNRTYGGSSDDVGTYGQQTKDGGYIITGYTSSYGADAPFSWLIKVQHRGDLWLIKTDAEGQKEWDRTYGGLGKDLGFFVQQTKDEGYIIVGGKKSFWIIGSYDLWIIKTDAKGNVLWDRTFGGSGEDLGFSVQQTNDDGYIIAGYTSFTNGKKAWIIKIDSQGNVFATGPGGIWIFNRTGKLIGKIKLDSVTAANCALTPDSKTLYITAVQYLLRVKLR